MGNLCWKLSQQMVISPLFITITILTLLAFFHRSPVPKTTGVTPQWGASRLSSFCHQSISLCEESEKIPSCCQAHQSVNILFQEPPRYQNANFKIIDKLWVGVKNNYFPNDSLKTKVVKYDGMYIRISSPQS